MIEELEAYGSRGLGARIIAKCAPGSAAPSNGGFPPEAVGVALQRMRVWRLPKRLVCPQRCCP